MVAATSRAIMSSRLQSHLGGDVEKLVGVVWFSRTSSGCGDLRIVKELHRRLFLLLRLRDGCGLVDTFGDFLSATNNIRPAQGRAVAAELKDFVVIFSFVEVLCNVRCFF